jgi:hypothetical protein
MGIHQKSGSLGMPQGILISTSDPRETQAKATNSLSMIISIQNTAIGICQEEFDAYVLSLLALLCKKVPFCDFP